MQGGYVGIVSMLIAAGANADKCTPDGCTLLAWAVKVSASQGRLMFAVNG